MVRPAFRIAVLFVVAVATAPVRADSTSSASSAGSTSSGSVSTSFRQSSDSSTSSSRRDKTTAYRIVEIAAAPDRAGMTRLTLDAAESVERLVLELPRVVAEHEALARGDVVEARPQPYGWAFARAGAADAFFLVLTDAWSDQLVARPVSAS